jgi:hypothetical protein
MGRKSNLPKIIEALSYAPAGLTQIQLQRITGASSGTVCRYIHQLHDEGKVHITSWKTDEAGKVRGGVYQARYRLGKGEDKPKPPALTPTEIKRRVRQRKKQEGELAEYLGKLADQERVRYWKRKPVRRDPLVSALFGAAA